MTQSLMGTVLIALLAQTNPVAANDITGLRRGDRVRLVLPTSVSCETSVALAGTQELSLRLRKTTNECGIKGSVVRIGQARVTAIGIDRPSAGEAVLEASLALWPRWAP